MAAITSIAAVATAIAAVAGTSVAAVEADRGNSARKKASRLQEKAQAESAAQATAQIRRNEEEQRKANKKQPDVGQLLSAEQADRVRGPQSAMAAGAKGGSLGRTSLLGGA